MDTTKDIAQVLTGLSKENLTPETAARVIQIASILSAKKDQLKKDCYAVLDALGEKELELDGIALKRVALMERAYNGSLAADSAKEAVESLTKMLAEAKEKLQEELEKSGYTHEQEKSFYYKVGK